MNLVGRIFGTNGVRGVFGREFSLEFVHDIALAMGKYFGSGRILVGYDGRESSPLIARMVCSALNYAGLDCSTAGLVPTPALEFAVKEMRYDGGVMVTASHNPPEYNGIKPVAPDGVEISRSDERVIEDIYLAKKCGPGRRWGKTAAEDGVLSRYSEGVCRQVNPDRIRNRKYTIVLDAGNGAQAVAAPGIAKMLGCQVHVINETISGDFPGRGSEPTPSNLGRLSEAIRDRHADIGIAFDGDGDRSMICDENGAVLTGDRSALALSKFLLEQNRASKVVTCVNSGSAIERLAAEYDSNVIRTIVGSVEVSRRMVLEDALIGFEENGGFMFGPHNHVRDGCMTMALFLDMMAGCGMTVSGIMSSLPASHTAKTKLACTPEQAARAVSALRAEHPDADARDGIKITLNEREWVMVRPSGTEPILRIYAESYSQEALSDLLDRYESKVKSAL